MARASKGQDRQPASVPAVDGVAAELEGLERLELAALRLQFRNRTGRIAPARISRPLLLRMLSYRIQAEAFGDLGRDIRRLLDRLGSSSGDEKPGVSRPAMAEAPLRLRPGTLLSREWQGRMERVMVLDEGFAWNGTSYPSLSAVAFAITGTKWNGYRFFGLRGQKTIAGVQSNGADAAGPTSGSIPVVRSFPMGTSARCPGAGPAVGGRS